MFITGAYQPWVLRVLAHPLLLGVHFLKCVNCDHVIVRYGKQPMICEFLAKPRQARPYSNIASVILIDDSSEESDDKQEADAVASQEKVTCSESISVERMS